MRVMMPPWAVGLSRWEAAARCHRTGRDGGPERDRVTSGRGAPSFHAGPHPRGREARDVTEQRRDEPVVEAWKAHRPYLIDLAFRMLGDIGAAEDVVQDAFSRLLRTSPGEIDDARGWLIVVTSRLCLDQIRSARARRERPRDAGEIEFVASGQQPPGPDAPGDPADRVTLDDSV